MRRNRQAIDRLALRPRVLRDVSAIDASHSFLGKPTRLPVVLAPIGGLEALSADGGLTVARAASAFGVPFILSSVSEAGMEAVGKSATGMKIFQLYTRGDADWVDGQVRQAMDLGYDAFCITVDSAVYSRRERDIAKRFAKPWRGRGGKGPGRHAVSGGVQLERRAAPARQVQGAAHPQGHRHRRGRRDRLRAKASSASTSPITAAASSTMASARSTCCPRSSRRCAGARTVVVDGGFCRGTDIVKALALGADMVGIGRVYCYGLVAAGSEGIVRVLELIEAEIMECLGLLGVTRHRRS